MYLCAYLLDYSACKGIKLRVSITKHLRSREKLSYTNIPNNTHLLLLIQCLKTRLKIGHCILGTPLFSMSTGTGVQRVWVKIRLRVGMEMGNGMGIQQNLTHIFSTYKHRICTIHKHEVQHHCTKAVKCPTPTVQKTSLFSLSQSVHML